MKKSISLKKVLFFLLFTKETTSVSEVMQFQPLSSAGLRLIPAIVLSALITAIGFLSVSYFLFAINYPGFEKWLW
jgi:predicted RND superfamily exporter protein